MKLFITTIVFLFGFGFQALASDGSCLSALGSGLVPNGGTMSGFTTPLASPGFPCNLTTVTCSNGRFLGPDLYPTCVDANPSCPNPTDIYPNCN